MRFAQTEKSQKKKACRWLSNSTECSETSFNRAKYAFYFDEPTNYLDILSIRWLREF